MYVRRFLLLGVISVLLVACGGQENPVEVAQSFMAAIEAVDIDKAQGLVCQAQRDRVRESLEPFAGQEQGETFEIKLEDLTFHQVSNDGETAIVHIDGKLTLSFLGRHETQEINQDHRLIKEKGQWLVCDP